MLGTYQRLIGVLACLAVVAVSTSCTGKQETATPEPSPTRTTAGPPPKAPKDRACYQLSFDQALAPSNSSEPVDCATAHTSQTFKVGELSTVVDGHLLATDSDSVRAEVATGCARALGTFVSAEPDQLRLTVLRSVWFTPSHDEALAGANWFRCDVIAVAGDAQLADITGGLAGDLANESIRASYGICGTAAPDAKEFTRVVCSAEHSWRAIKVVDLTVGQYPGEDEVRVAGQDTCEDAAQAVADNALDFQWGYEWPTKQQWSDGQTWGLCWAPA